MKFLRFIFGPPGYSLLKENGACANRIRGDLIPNGMLVIRYEGRNFVRTGAHDPYGFAIYQEGAKTHVYSSFSA